MAPWNIERFPKMPELSMEWQINGGAQAGNRQHPREHTRIELRGTLHAERVGQAEKPTLPNRLPDRNSLVPAQVRLQEPCSSRTSLRRPCRPIRECGPN